MAKSSGKKSNLQLHVTEKNAYAYINAALKELGWDTHNPSRNPHGQVYTDNQALEHPELRKGLGKDRPENVVKLTETKFWVIEAKSKRTEIDKAVGEAEGYARNINEKAPVEAVIISGVAGNDDDGYLVHSKFSVGNTFHPVKLNGKEITGLLSPIIAERLVAEGNPNLQDVPLDEGVFLATAEAVNEYLHRGAINKNDRARVMAALLLALVDDTPPNIDANPRVLIKDINSRAETVLERNDKKEFFPFIEIQLPAAKDNHVKFRRAIVQTIQALTNLNIRSTMSSGTDMLGKFYEVFLKYGNGAKEIGIVLTPRHITRFAAEILDVDYTDVVYDPACGTGGFLVAALDYVRSKFSFNAPQPEKFKLHGLFGIDQDPVVTTLAIVNMIFRNDGRNHIIEGNSLAKYLQQVTVDGHPSAEVVSAQPASGVEGATKILMNPPFALRVEPEKEYRFVQHALEQLQDGGLLFSVLPISVMFESGEVKEWRLNKLLAENTLLSVITFPPELFYPTGNHTLGIIVRKGIPHHRQQNVLWVRAMHDGFVKVKGKRLLAKASKSEPDDLKVASPLIQAFIRNPAFVVSNQPEFMKAAPIDYEDTLLELVPEAYLDAIIPSITDIEQSAEQLVRDTAALAIRFPELWSKHEKTG
jgi:type I restriction enzyme M protein